MFKLPLIFLSIVLLVGCAQGHCNRKGSPAVADEMRKIWIYKYDNSRQCEPESGISEEKMSKELLDIKVYSMKKLSDGQPRVQVCGALTGMTNAYEIKQKDLALAETLGFKRWDF